MNFSGSRSIIVPIIGLFAIAAGLKFGVDALRVHLDATRQHCIAVHKTAVAGGQPLNYEPPGCMIDPVHYIRGR